MTGPKPSLSPIFRLSAVCISVFPIVSKTAAAELEAEVEVAFFAYLEEREDAEDILASGTVLLGSSWERSTSPWSLHGKVRLQADSEDYTDGSALFIDDGLRRPYLLIDETYLQFVGDRWEFRAGNQYFADGEGEFYSLADPINARDLLDLPSHRKLPSLSLAGFHYGEAGTLRVVTVPVFIPSRIPRKGDRWFPDFPEAERSLPLTFLGRELPGRTLDNLQAGLQWKSSKLIPNGDIGFHVFHGIDTIGVYSINPLRDALGLIQVFPRYTEWNVTFQVVYEQYSFYGEAGYHDTESDVADDDYLENLFGFSVDLTDQSLVHLDDLRVFLEYAGETTVNRAETDDTSGGFLPTRQFTRPLQNTLILGLRAEQFLRWEVDSGIVFNLDGGDWLVQLGGRYRTDSGVGLNLQAVFLNGASNSLFGRWRKNDRLSFSIEYSY